MRTAVVRVNVDPGRVLTPTQLGEGMGVLLGLSDEIGASVVENDLAAMPVGRREIQLLIAADDVDAAKQTVIDLCTKAFSTTPVLGVATFVSRGPTTTPTACCRRSGSPAKSPARQAMTVSTSST